MDLRCLTMALIRTGGTPMVLANRYWEMPSSSMISARCSPGWIGSGHGHCIWTSSMIQIDQLLSRHHVSESFDGYVGGAFAFGNSNQ